MLVICVIVDMIVANGHGHNGVFFTCFNGLMQVDYF